MVDHAPKTETAARPSLLTGDPVVLLAGVLLIGVAAWRARYGISIYDSSHYTVEAVRLAQGIRPFVDDMTLQSTGFLAAGPFAKLWMLAFGRTGIELALRLFFVALAAGSGAIVFRALRPSFGPWPSLLAAAVPLLAPPYNVLAVSYNTMALLGFTVGTALAFSAARDESRAAAAGAGAAFALGVVSYPPLMIGAAVGLAAFALVTRSPRLAAWMLAGAAAVAAPVFAWLLATGSLSGLQGTMARGAAMTSGDLPARLRRFRLNLSGAREQLTRLNAWPAWALAVAALLPLRPRWIRAAALGLVPLAVALPALGHVSTGQYYIGVIGAVMLLAFVAVAFVPVTVWSAAGSGRDARRLLWLAAPLGLVDTVLVVYSTNAGWSRGTAFVGFAPLAMAVVALWSYVIAERGGKMLAAAAGVSLVAVVVVMLFATAFQDGFPVDMKASITHGAYAGMRTIPYRAKELEAIEAVGRRCMRPDDSVLVFRAPGVYLLLPGRILTSATWLEKGPSDHFALEYLARRNDMPTIVVAQREDMDPLPPDDPLLQTVAADYRLVGETEQLLFYRRR